MDVCDVVGIEDKIIWGKKKKDINIPEKDDQQG